MRDAFAAIKRCERFVCSGDLPLVGVEIGGNRFGPEKGTGAAGILSELVQAAFGRAAHAN